MEMRLAEMVCPPPIWRGHRSTFSFSDQRGEGTRHDTTFAPFDVFYLALSLDLLDAGFKQLEVVFFIRHFRSRLRTIFELILEKAPALRENTGDGSRPNLPTTRSRPCGRAEATDCYLIDLVRDRMDYPSLKRAALSLRSRWPAATILIEDKGSRTSLIQDLRQEKISVIAINSGPISLASPHARSAPRSLATTAIASAAKRPSLRRCCAWALRRF